jgi:pimeloyl-ACP methyl ester carboxylesterase
MTISETATSSLPTAGGGCLEVLAAGPEDGLPLLFHVGTPAAAVPFPLLNRAAADRSLRVVCYSRPGYGESTARPRHSIADDVSEMTMVLDRFGIERFVTLGWSGGGPRALACAAMLPDRCLAAAVLAGVAPYDAEGLAWLDGMGEENVAEFAAAAAGPEALEDWLDREGSALFTVTPNQVAAVLGDLASEVDRNALTGELADFLAASGRHAGRQGVTGWRDDDLALMRPWGFDLGRITVPTSIWQGGQDRMVPFAHGQWLARHVAGARAHLYEGEGHISLVMQVDRILDDLLARAGAV